MRLNQPNTYYHLEPLIGMSLLISYSYSPLTHLLLIRGFLLISSLCYYGNLADSVPGELVGQLASVTPKAAQSSLMSPQY